LLGVKNCSVGVDDLHEWSFYNEQVCLLHIISASLLNPSFTLWSDQSTYMEAQSQDLFSKTCFLLYT
jgi:hypothetical protein